MENAHTIILVAACLHNFGLMHDNWIDDAPPIHMNEVEEDDYENNDAVDAAIGFEKRRMLAEEMI